ncbi:MAG: UDP-N-acetylmuramoyl-tripeptide--D-alanyl-D-alanine ligase [Nitrospira sp. SB0678_bin_10]|nr:UDP-N-acetylmuramoyl-tripeptide--D-alanyl-D-alanine ligase [Nitrospira sp. SB0678_bin_10]MYI88004.1 UDP-N-acetylmuramoyl-tripeptide--D-alanyl-D-alanine ligase [Synechococcus sp. SB0672_bin_10]
MFLALRGESFDGHHYLTAAAARGACAAVVEATAVPEHPPLPLLPVADTHQAYQDLARAWRRQLGLPLVAVTGSAGKTTTRELIKALLAPKGVIHTSQLNENNAIGVPRTILTADDTAAAMVVEMAMRGPGEIAELSRCAEPDLAVITNIGSAHIGRLGSREAIAAAKCEITTALASTGLVVIPAGDPLLEASLAARWHGPVHRVALSDDALPSPLPPADQYGQLQGSDLHFGGRCWRLPLPGIHQAHNLMLALVCAERLGVTPENRHLTQVRLPGGRARQLRLGGVTVWDETYNASPEAVVATTAMVAEQQGRHFAVLGPMLELGSFALDWHRRVGEHVVRRGFAGLVVVDDGPLGDALVAGAGRAVPVVQVSEPQAALGPVLAWLKPGDHLLLKASRGAALERLVPLLQARLNPARTQKPLSNNPVPLWESSA